MAEEKDKDKQISSDQQSSNTKQDSSSNQDITKMAEELGKLRKVAEEFDEYKQKVNPVLETIWSNVELLEHATKIHNQRLGITTQDSKDDKEEKNDGEDKQTTTKKPEYDPRVEAIDIKSREDAIAEIEKKYGYNTLQADKVKDLRRRVELKLNAWGTSITKAPVNQLNKLLEDAYLLEDLGNAREEKRLDTLLEVHENPAALPSMSSQSAVEEGPQMTDQHKSWAKKLGTKEDKVAENLKELMETGKITYKPKEPDNNKAQASPSGQPNVPQSS